MLPVNVFKRRLSRLGLAVATAVSVNSTNRLPSIRVPLRAAVMSTGTSDVRPTPASSGSDDNTTVAVRPLTKSTGFGAAETSGSTSVAGPQPRAPKANKSPTIVEDTRCHEHVTMIPEGGGSSNHRDRQTSGPAKAWRGSERRARPDVPLAQRNTIRSFHRPSHTFEGLSRGGWTTVNESHDTPSHGPHWRTWSRMLTSTRCATME